MNRTFGVEGDEAVAQRPLLHRLFQDHLLGEDDHVDVVEPAEALQDLGHGLGFGLLGHGTDAHHNLSLRRLVEEETRSQYKVGQRLLMEHLSLHLLLGSSEDES